MTISSVSPSLSNPHSRTANTANNEHDSVATEPHGAVQRIFNTPDGRERGAVESNASELDYKSRIQTEEISLRNIQKRDDDFREKTRHLKLIEGQQLRLKDDRIKPARYYGANPFKHMLQAIGARSHTYEKQIGALREKYDLHSLPSVDHGAISEHFKTSLENQERLLDRLKLACLREELRPLQTEARKHATSHPALQALVVDTDKKRRDLNSKLNELRTRLSSYQADRLNKKEQCRQQTGNHRLVEDLEKIAHAINDTQLDIEKTASEAEVKSQSYNELDALSEQIASKQREIHKQSGTLISAAPLPVDLGLFLAIWHTPPGWKAIQASFEQKTDVSINATEVAHDLESRHQMAGNSFSLSPRQQSQLRDAAALLSTYEILEKQCRQVYLDTLKRYEDAPDIEPFRRLTYFPNKLSSQQLDEFDRLMTRQVPFSFPKVLETYDTLIESDFHDTNTVFEVYGCSMKRAYDALLPGTPEFMTTNLFTPFAVFRVEHIARKADSVTMVRLVEHLMPLDAAVRPRNLERLFI
ncbi:MAG TPA: hypothetical protein VIM98_09165 [Dyella sp.]|uniref:hypothetical protein n=1 Tax=Dyella sp. TaxID=1869338 RepID=UPI002F94C8C3